MYSYISVLLILIAVLVLHLWGIQGGYVWHPWFDVVLHGMSGVAVGIFAIQLFKEFWSESLRPSIVVILVIVVAVGVAWEIFEIIFDIAKYPLWTTLYYLDTLKDLFMDIVGGIVAVCIKRSESSFRRTIL